MFVIGLIVVLSVNPDCPNVPGGCTGTAVNRAEAARSRARMVDLNRRWDAVREDIVEACGLRVQESTSHCFNDFNHGAAAALSYATRTQKLTQPLSPLIFAVRSRLLCHGHGTATRDQRGVAGGRDAPCELPGRAHRGRINRRSRTRRFLSLESRLGRPERTVKNGTFFGYAQ